MRAQRELRKAQREIDALEKKTKKITTNYNRLTQFLATNNNLNIQSYRSNTKSTRSNSNNAFLNNLERQIANNNKKSSNENDAMFDMIYNRRVNSNSNTATFNIVEKMLNNTMRNHRAGIISTNQMQKNLIEYLNHIGNRYRNSNRGSKLERKIRWYMGR